MAHKIKKEGREAAQEKHMLKHNADMEAKEIAENWIETYSKGNSDLADFVKTFPPDPTADQMDELFRMGPPRVSGVRIKRQFKCHECRQRFPEIVYVGERYENEIALCKGCVKELYEYFS